MRQGLLFIGDLSIEDTLAIGRAADVAGFDSLNYVEAYRSAFVPLAALAGATQRVQLRTYIANAYAHNPFAMGLLAFDLDELSHGRFVLGIGTGNRHLNDLALGVDRAGVYGKMREYTEIVRKMLSAAQGQLVSFEGTHHKIRWRQTGKPFRERIPVHVAAVFPKMIDVAAGVADGIALGVLLSPEYLRDVVRPRIARAAEAAGRDPAAIALPMGALAAVGDNLDDARNAVRAAIASLFHPMPHPYYEFLLREQGYSKVADAAKRLVPAGKTAEVIEMMEDDLIDRLALAGTADRISRRLADYEGLVDEVVYLNVGRSTASSALERYRPLLSIRPPGH